MSNLALKVVAEQGDCVSLLAMLKQMSDEKKKALVRSPDFNKIFRKALEDENWPIVQCFWDLQASREVMDQDNKQGKRIAALPDRPLRMFVDELCQLTEDQGTSKNSLYEVKEWILSGLKKHKDLVAKALTETEHPGGKEQATVSVQHFQRSSEGGRPPKQPEKKKDSPPDKGCPATPGSDIDRQVDAIFGILFQTYDSGIRSDTTSSGSGSGSSSSSYSSYSGYSDDEE